MNYLFILLYLKILYLNNKIKIKSLITIIFYNELIKSTYKLMLKF